MFEIAKIICLTEHLQFSQGVALHVASQTVEKHSQSFFKVMFLCWLCSAFAGANRKNARQVKHKSWLQREQGKPVDGLRRPQLQTARLWWRAVDMRHDSMTHDS